MSTNTQILPPLQPLNALPKRNPGTSGINNSEATPYNEADVEAEFNRAGFEDTKPYIPRHSDSKEDMAATNRESAAAVRLVRPLGAATLSGIEHSYNLGMALMQRREMAVVEDPTRLGNIDDKARDDWGNLDQATDWAKARKAAHDHRADLHPVDVQRPRPADVGRSHEPRRHSRSLLNILRRRR